VLDRVAELSRWGEPLPDGSARGLALHPGFGSHIALVAEVRLSDGAVRVPRVVAVADCGQTVNPQIVEAQIEGGIVFALSAALFGRIDVRAGRTVQSNFHDYRMVRLPDAPEVEVHLIESREPPGGIGELSVPPTAPAVANALTTLTGKPVRQLPLVAD
jgi:isoquinoline 1-oxidoreductase beta subunit